MDEWESAEGEKLIAEESSNKSDDLDYDEEYSDSDYSMPAKPLPVMSKQQLSSSSSSGLDLKESGIATHHKPMPSV